MIYIFFFAFPGVKQVSFYVTFYFDRKPQVLRPSRWVFAQAYQAMRVILKVEDCHFRQKIVEFASSQGTVSARVGGPVRL